MSDGEDHVSRSTFEEFKHLLDEKFRSMEARLTWRLVLAAVVGSALGKAVGPSVAAVFAALGVIGWGIKVAIVALLHR
jgi:hypothetical protein